MRLHNIKNSLLYAASEASIGLFRHKAYYYLTLTLNSQSSDILLISVDLKLAQKKNFDCCLGKKFAVLLF